VTEGARSLQSMTGYGRGQATCGGARVEVELRSVNHRSLDVRARGQDLQRLEARIHAAVRQQVQRGAVQVQVQIAAADADEAALVVDPQALAAWRDVWAAAAAEVGGPAAGPDVRWLLERPGVVVDTRDQPPDAGAIVGALEQALDEGLAALVASRRAEGARLAEDLRARLATLGSLHAAIEADADAALQAYRARLHARIAELVGRRGLSIDDARLETELVIYADKSDVTEELVRLRGHLEAFGQALDEPGAGRKLGFLAQELLREVNTIGSKSTGLAITERVVAAKVEIEKIREQVQNLA
jgi:uncharacterized protein (TIGR00255 family)